jgi:hypothetical protein
MSDRYLHPGNVDLTSPVIASSDGSPVYLPATDEQATPYWVKGEAHAWIQINSSEVTPGEIIERDLQLASNLSVLIEDFQKIRGQQVVVHEGTEGAPIALYTFMEGDVVTFDGLPPGLYSARLAVGDGSPITNLEIDRSEPVRLRAGESTSVSLRGASMPEPGSHGSLHGSLTIQSEDTWRDMKAFTKAALVLTQKEASVGLASLRASKRRRAVHDMTLNVGSSLDSPVRFWSLDEIPAGEYLLRFEPLSLDFPVTVIPGETTSYDIVVPSLARTLVDVVGQKPDAQGVFVMALDPKSDLRFLAERGGGETLDAHSTAWSVLTLPGEIRIVCSAPGGGSQQDTISVQVGWNSHLVELDANPFVVLRATDDSGEEIPVEWWSSLEIESLTGTHEVVEEALLATYGSKPGGRQNRVRIAFSGEGLFRVQYPCGDGAGGNSSFVEIPVSAESAGELIDLPCRDDP